MEIGTGLIVMAIAAGAWYIGLSIQKAARSLKIESVQVVFKDDEEGQSTLTTLE